MWHLQRDGHSVDFGASGDSIAAIGMIHRRGTGRVRHLDVRHLKLQEMIREGVLGGIEKLPTEFNRADLGTKVHDAKRMAFLTDLIGMYDCSARHEVNSVTGRIAQVAKSSGPCTGSGLIDVVEALQRAVMALAQVVRPVGAGEHRHVTRALSPPG